MSSSQLQAIHYSRLVNRSPVFYGWVIMAVSTLGMIMTSPGQTYSVSIFLEHFINDLGVSRSLVSTLYTIGTLVGSFALPFVGRQIDRHGPRRMMVMIATLFGLACIYMGFVSNAVMLGLGFVAIRMLGQGSLGLVSQNVINQWWVRRRGTMLGISGMTVSLVGLGGFPNLINGLLKIYDWRSTYMLLGVMLLSIMVPVGFIFVRSRPELYGLQPDGHKTITPNPDISPHKAEFSEENWTLQEALRVPIFWTLAAGLASISMLGTGLTFHMVSIFKDSGLDSTLAASVFVPIAITTAIVNLGSGILLDRISARLLLSTALVFQTTSLLMAQFLGSIELAFLYGIVLGATTGLMFTVHSVSWAKYFGRQHLGSITGVTSTILIAGSALGPMPLGIARDLLGSYNLVLSLAASFPLVLAVINLLLGKPPKRR